jgi:triacylglycerol lipase
LHRRLRPLLWVGLCAVLTTSALVFLNRRPSANRTVGGSESRELVVLVHGMGRTSASMVVLARTLEREGFHVLNWGYSSTCCSVAQLGERLAADLGSDRIANYKRVHFVGHSLGTVIIRSVLANDTSIEHVGRVVMLAPPNQGSRKADRTAKLLGRWLKPLPELQTTSTSTARVLAVPSGIQVGVIAGRYDGKVEVAETHLDGESAHVVVPATHSLLMFRSDVRDLTIRFLRTGSFTASD